MIDMNDLIINFAMPASEPAALRLVPVRFTEDNGPLHPLGTHSRKLEPGKSFSVRVSLMAAFHAHLVGADPGARCGFVASVDEGSKSAANFVTMHRFAKDGPWEPDFMNPLLVRPGETRRIDISDGAAIHVHEIVLIHE